LAEHGWKLREIGEDGIKEEGLEGSSQGKCKKVANCWWNTHTGSREINISTGKRKILLVEGG